MYYLTDDKFINLTYNIQCFSNNDYFTYKTAKYLNLYRININCVFRDLAGKNGILFQTREFYSESIV